MTLHLASELLRLMYQQVVIWGWNSGTGTLFFFFQEKFKVTLSTFKSLVVSKLHVLIYKLL